MTKKKKVESIAQDFNWSFGKSLKLEVGVFFQVRGSWWGWTLILVGTKLGLAFIGVKLGVAN